RRDQAAGAAGAGMHAAGGAEAAAFAVGLQQFVLGDLQFAVPHAFHAPQAAVVVHGRALAGAPGHGDHAVAEVGAAVDLAAGVVVVEPVVHAGGQAHGGVADQLAQHAAQARGHCVPVAAAHGRVNGRDEAVLALEGDAGGGVGCHAPF